MLTRAFDRCKTEHADGGRIRATIPRLESAGGGTLMAIHSTHLETLEAVIATALNIVKNRTLADLYVRRDYTGEFRIRVQLESGQRYVITIKEE
jgi:hypothetical protein